MIDADTLMVREDGKLHTVQLIGADAPEPTGSMHSPQCYDNQATAYAARLFAFNRDVDLATDQQPGDKDIYGRELRYVYFSDGKLYNEELLKAGLARVFSPQDKTFSLRDNFQQQQDYASSRQLGIWSSACNGRF